MKTRFLLTIFLMTSLIPAYAYNYNSTPMGTVNPPETMSQDPNIRSHRRFTDLRRPYQKSPHLALLRCLEQAITTIQTILRCITIHHSSTSSEDTLKFSALVSTMLPA